MKTIYYIPYQVLNTCTYAFIQDIAIYRQLTIRPCFCSRSTSIHSTHQPLQLHVAIVTCKHLLLSHSVMQTNLSQLAIQLYSHSECMHAWLLFTLLYYFILAIVQHSQQTCYQQSNSNSCVVIKLVLHTLYSTIAS